MQELFFHYAKILACTAQNMHLYKKNAAHIQGRTDLPHQMEIACATSISIGSRYLCIDNATLTS